MQDMPLGWAWAQPDRSPVLTGTCPGTLPLSVNAAGEEQP